MRVFVIVASLVITLAAMPAELVLAQCPSGPKITAGENGQPGLILPRTLEDLIRAKFSDFRVPSNADMTDAWATETSPGMLPFFSTGDFNGDGLKDAAILLTSDKYWKLVIFNGERGCSYSVGFETGGEYDGASLKLQLIFIQTLRKGEAASTGEQTERHKFKTDAVELTFYEQSSALIYWKADKYEVIDFTGD